MNQRKLEKSTYIMFMIGDWLESCDDTVKLLDLSFRLGSHLNRSRFHCHIRFVCVGTTLQLLNDCSFHKDFVCLITVGWGIKKAG